MEDIICPKCGSSSTYKSKKYNAWICEDCGEKFTETVAVCKRWNDGLDATDYWNNEFISVAPVSLAVSYQKLQDYVTDGNIGCTLFLIRDVFELVIKIPVTIMFNGVHDLKESYPDFDKILAVNKPIEKLYDYSIQMLSTGKWWECVRLAAGIKADLWDNLAEDYPKTLLLKDTCDYLSKLYKMLFFRVPGNSKTSMVTWRNRVLGHSCLADNIQDKYVEIPYILDMFQQVCEVSIPFYSRICFCDRNKNPLFGINANLSEAEVFIQYKNESDKQDIILIIHDFLAGRDNSLSCFDGFEKGKAYLLSYSSGERYRDFKLSEYLSKHGDSRTDKLMLLELSSENVFSDNLESKDIETLEELLASKDDVIGINSLYQWLLDTIATADKGILFLSAESGLGKSTFCTTIDQLDRVGVKKMDEALLEEWYELASDTAIRVWHFNSDYRGRKDIFIPGIRDAVLTLGNDTSTGRSRANILKGKLEAQWNSLLTCDKNLRKLLFAECLNDTVSEYRDRTDKKKMILVLDGIDEVSNVKELFSFLPDAEYLDEGVYLMLSCRTASELENKPELLNLIEKCRFSSSVCFTRKSLIREVYGKKSISENGDYNFAIAEYIKDILEEQGKSVCMDDVTNISEMFENRFSAVAAYRELCRLNPVFTDCSDGNLFQMFITQIEQNAPESYLRRVKAILNTLLWADEPLTIQELAYLSGERYVSYRMLGLLNDLRAFVRVSRSSDGNRYEIAHSQWKEAISTWMPYGDVYFRQRCSMMLEEVDQSFNAENIMDLFDHNYAGERWVFTHVLNIYSRNRYDLEENWWESICIGAFESLFDKFITFVDGHEDVRLLTSAWFIDMFKGISSDYRRVLSDFSYDPNGERGYKYYNKQSNEYYLLEKMVNFLSHISKLILNDYTDLDGDMSVNPALPAAAEYRFHAGEILVDYSVLRGENRSSRSKMRKRALELFAPSIETASWYGFRHEDNIIIEASMRMGDIHIQNQEYEYAYMVYERVITLLEMKKKLSVDMRMKLAKAYMEIGRAIPYLDKNNPPVYYLGKMEPLECYQKACEMISCLLKEDSDNLAFWKLYKSVTYLIGKVFFKETRWEKALYWYKEHLTSIEKQNSVDKYAEYSAYRLVGDTYVSLKDAEHALEYYQNAYQICCDFNLDRFEILQRLIHFPADLLEKKDVFEKEYAEEVKKRNEYGDAYQEVLEILKHTEKDAVAKIPKRKMQLFHERQNKNHGFRCDPTKTLDEQGVMKRTKAILAIIYRDYWASDKQRETIEQHEDRDRIENRAKLMQELIKEMASAKRSNEDVTLVSSKAFSEAFWLLEHLPPVITRKIPIEVLLDIKSKRDRSYSIHFNTDGGNKYLEDTLYYLDCLFKKYAPDTEALFSDYCKHVPGDFDLNCIFEDDFE